MVKIITPYINDKEIVEHKRAFSSYNIYYEKDTAGIGSDLMFQKMWNKFPDDDIFILHADMYPHHDKWLEEVEFYAKSFPEAGMLGCLLLYPLVNDDTENYIQSAGGRFINNRPDHYGSGYSIATGVKFKEQLEIDRGQYNKVREVAWTTFGGCYLKRSFINSVGRFSPEYEWTYNRDVDFCLRAREAGQHIYQIPVRLYHYESLDNARIKALDPSKVAIESRNLERLQNKWKNSPLFKTIDIEKQYN